MHFYKIGIDSENLPNKFRAAALLLKRWKEISIEFGSPEINFNPSLHTLRHYFGLFCSRNKNERYSAAEKLCGAYFRAASNKGMAFLADSFSDSASKNIELASGYETFISSRSVRMGLTFYLSLVYELDWLDTSGAFWIVDEWGSSLWLGVVCWVCCTLKRPSWNPDEPWVGLFFYDFFSFKMGDWHYSPSAF